jgi:hypothetical protein
MPHETIPFQSKQDRICIAVNLIIVRWRLCPSCKAVQHARIREIEAT